MSNNNQDLWGLVNALQRELHAIRALALTGIPNAHWRHSIARDIGVIRGRVVLIRMDLEAGNISAAIEQLDHIKDDCGRVLTESTYENLLSAAPNLELDTFITQYVSSKEFIARDVRFMVKPDSKAQVRIIPSWLIQVLDILLDNSMRAIMELEEKVIKIETSTTEGNAEIHVVDNGPGLSTEVASKVFLDPISNEEDNSRMGIGLLIARIIIETYGGTMRLTSTRPGRTEFVITLPIT
jgi:signal transduction histidine kinase